MSLYPKRTSRSVTGIDYNLSGWLTLIAYLRKWGVDVSEFSLFNDGAPISPEICLAVGNAIEKHRRELSAKTDLGSEVMLASGAPLPKQEVASNGEC